MDSNKGVQVGSPEEECTSNYPVLDHGNFWFMQIIRVQEHPVLVTEWVESTLEVILEDIVLAETQNINRLVFKDIYQTIKIIFNIFAIPG